MEKKLFYTVVITSLLIAIIITFFIASIIRYHQRYISLQKERLHAQINTQEQERKRIANDLHDSLGPMLSTVKLYLQGITVSSADDELLLNKALVYIDESITNLRGISYNLLPSSLSRTDLISALKEYIYRITKLNHLKIYLSSTNIIIIPKPMEVHLFRIFQEIIQNTIKHSRANTLRLFITGEPGGLLIISEDDGIGFDIDHTRKNGTGLGLKSIESRCEMINATLRVHSAKSKGCTISIQVSGFSDLQPD